MAKFEENIAQASRDLRQRGVGATFWVKSTVVNARLSTTALNLTNDSVLGELEVEDIIIRGGAGGGLSGGGTFRITSTNNYGSSVILSVAITHVGTAKVVTLGALRAAYAAAATPNDVGSVNLNGSQPTILEEGKKLKVDVEKTGTAGDGSVTVHVKFRRLDDEANVMVA